MRKILATVTISIITLVLTAGIATASGPVSHSEADTRKASGIPHAVVYLKGTSVWVDNHTRCFQGQATKRTHIQGHPIHLGRIVGYCTDGYVDRTKGSNMSQYVIINPGR